jgi:hypothetical protein
MFYWKLPRIRLPGRKRWKDRVEKSFSILSMPPLSPRILCEYPFLSLSPSKSTDTPQYAGVCKVKSRQYNSPATIGHWWQQVQTNESPSACTLIALFPFKSQRLVGCSLKIRPPSTTSYEFQSKILSSVVAWRSGIEQKFSTHMLSGLGIILP